MFFSREFLLLCEVCDRREKCMVLYNVAKIQPALIPAVKSFDKEQKPSILHAAINAKAPLNIFHSIINYFGYSILKSDSFGRFPIVLAILKKGLGWNEGMQQVAETTAVA